MMFYCFPDGVIVKAISPGAASLLRTLKIMQDCYRFYVRGF